MTNFILGFLSGVIAEFVALFVIAKQVQKRRDKEILAMQRLNEEAKEHISDFLHLQDWDNVRNLSEEERDGYIEELYKVHNMNMTDLQEALRGDNNGKDNIISN